MEYPMIKFSPPETSPKYAGRMTRIGMTTLMVITHGAVAVAIVGVLAQHGADQLINRRQVLAPLRVTVLRFQQRSDSLVFCASRFRGVRLGRFLFGHAAILADLLPP